MFVLASILTSASMIDERASGVWHRALAAGVKPRHFMLSHLIEGVLLVIINFIIYSTFALVFLLPKLSLQASSLMLLILALNAIAGTIFGLFVSVIFDSVSASQYVNQALVVPMTCICGSLSLNFKAKVAANFHYFQESSGPFKVHHGTFKLHQNPSHSHQLQLHYET
jgi:ABC-type multidrug transport system permease subunit